MSFGRRGPAKEKQVVAAGGPIARGNLKTVTEPGDAAIDTMKKVVIGVAGCVTLFMVYMLMPSRGPAQLAIAPTVNAHAVPHAPLMTGKLSAVTDENFDRIVFDFSDKDRNWLKELVLSEAGRRVRDACLPRLKREDIDAQAGQEWSQSYIGNSNDIYPWAIRTNYARGTEFLRCAVSAEPMRFCDEHHRKQLVEHLRMYALLHGLHVNRARKAWLAANPEQAKVIEASAPNLGPLADVGPKLDATLGRGVAEAMENGLLSVEDFGGVQAVPRVLTGYLRSRKRSICPPPAEGKK
jgi:hypothetical protein